MKILSKQEAARQGLEYNQDIDTNKDTVSNSAVNEASVESTSRNSEAEMSEDKAKMTVSEGNKEASAALADNKASERIEGSTLQELKSEEKGKKTKKITAFKKEKAPKDVETPKDVKAPKDIKALKDGKTPKKSRKEGKHKLRNLIMKLKELITYASEKTLPVRRQIRFKLVFAFTVPVLFLIVLGLYSYGSTKGTIVKNYKNSAKVSIENSSLYINLLMEDIQTKSSQIAGETSFQYYYNSYDTMNVADASELYDESKKAMLSLKNSSVGIYNIYAFGSKGTPMVTLEQSVSGNLYKDFTSSSEAAKWNKIATKKGGATSAWIGQHPSVDTDTSASTDFYVASYVRTFAKGDGYIVIDLLKDKIIDILEKNLVSKKSLTAFITADGRETIAVGSKKNIPDKGKKLVAEQSFYKKAISNKAESGIKNVKLDGQNYVFVYSKIGTTGAMICTMIPKSDIMSQLNATRVVTLCMVIIACLIAFFVGLILATDIAKVINKFSNTFKYVSAGDFTVRIDTKRKDEFGLLAHDMDDMLDKIQGLVTDMANFGHNVSDAAVKVSGASGEILTSVNEVSETVNVMNQGVSEQAKDTEKSFLQMTDFAGQIGEASDGFLTVGQVADKTQKTISGGKDIINKLMQQVTATSEVTSVIIKDIDELQVQSKNIGGVIETINDIASTTNLLSLNASIEAARAGDAGRGFAVVADQIRSLAEQSVESVKRIEKIIKTIQQKTQITVSSAKNAEQMLDSQTVALNNTVKVFQDVDQHMIELLDKINHIMNNMETISVSKDEVLDAIKNIAAVTEQTLASSEVVGNNINTQITAVETLSLQAAEMTDRAKELENAINRFKI